MTSRRRRAFRAPGARQKGPMNRFVAFTVPLLLSATVATATDVSTCGQTVEKGDVSVLTSDLVCMHTPYAVRLLHKSTLDLNGHTLTGGSGTYATVLAVARATGVLERGSGPG